MAKNLFSVPIFFIVFRETLEAAIIVSVLLSLVEQIVKYDDTPVDVVAHRRAATTTTDDEKASSEGAHPSDEPTLPSAADPGSSDVLLHRLIRRLRIQIFLGAGLGLLIALSIGAAFIAVWFTQARNLWSKSESLWEGIFSLVASLLIYGMGLTMLKMDRAKAKWRVKLQRAFFEKTQGRSILPSKSVESPGSSTTALGGADEGKTGKWVLFILPFITVLREGMEAVVFVGGVSLGQPATSIPIAAIVGLVCGVVCGYIIYAFASRATLTTFLVVMTNFILLIGAGLFSKAVGEFQENAFNNLLGQDVDDLAGAGDGPGSYDVRGNVWHLACCNPENKLDGEGWMIFAAIFGWTNSATLGTVLSYVFYWLAVIAGLIYMKFKEGRTKLMGRSSAAGVRRDAARARVRDADSAAPAYVSAPQPANATQRITAQREEEEVEVK
ncbi:iron permease FTR1 [Rickenella mellea]|uniref:Iron permease FTR1 n=1 Tax=Rickenella mellea TaxID=50990 RepID=A0A4Y7Q2R5_9AGAM|nr:iron permease FTR1 [Rickenella mellea]